MALVKCKECAREISSDAKACPGCGVKRKKSVGLIGYAVISIFGIAVIGGMTNSAPNKSAPPAPPLSPEANAAKEKVEAASNARFMNTVATLKSVKSALREPGSVQWEDISANEDGSVVCLTYRARNGFGGMAIERATMAKGQISTKSTAWNKHCAGKSLYEAKSALHALD